MTDHDAARASDRKPNRLIHATSPYLLQHAYNPVDWHEWGTEVQERARREDKPILLSVGYAACHWCHVMAHESFEDPAIARVMNEHFVCVKVDREERPDVDALYMDAVQALTGQGGWPMTVFLTPEGEPFFAGTYFPPEDRHGMPGFGRLLEAIAEAWRERRDDLTGQGKRMAEALARGSSLEESREPLAEAILRGVHGALIQAFDQEWGGFGGAPKFPQPMTLELLLRMHLRSYPGALEMVTRTLDAMTEGGIYDQLGGGFHRYSTDRRWLVPHFEKMLYDNAQLARVFLHAWQVTGRERYRRVVVETLDYLLREMAHPEGGFFSSQDADSEGEEGKFYAWSYEDLVRDAGGADGDVVGAYFGALLEGNWEPGRNVLWTPRPVDEVAPEHHRSPEDVERLVAAARQRLFEARERRVRPATDDKVLASWNGLAIVAFAEAGRVLQEPRYVEAATKALAFIEGNLLVDGRLHRAWREDRVSGPGYLDDYAFAVLGALAVYEATFDLDAMRDARLLADDMIRLFHDPDRGGFFQTGSDAERLLVRQKELFDNAVPSGNSVAAEVLLRLALLTGEEEYEQAGVSALRLVAPLLSRAPSAFGHALGALDLYLSSVKEIAIVGEPSAADTRALVWEIWRRYAPNVVLAVGRPGDGEAAAVIPLLADRPALDGKAAAYVCEHFACRLPVTEPAALAAQLEPPTG
jgi:uncharacterized protein YyaL (SSP411 family)